jgi:protein TonB
MRMSLLAPVALTVFVGGSAALGQDGSTIAGPHWLKQPSPADVVAVYPRSAARLGYNGRVTMSCTVQPDGSLTRCEIASEDPPDQGFADAAIKLSKLYKLASPDGSPLPRTTVDVPIRFSLAP